MDMVARHLFPPLQPTQKQLQCFILIYNLGEIYHGSVTNIHFNRSNKPSCRRLPQPFEVARQQTRRVLREFTLPESDSMFPRLMDVFMDEK